MEDDLHVLVTPPPGAAVALLLPAGRLPTTVAETDGDVLTLPLPALISDGTAVALDWVSPPAAWRLECVALEADLNGRMTVEVLRAAPVERRDEGRSTPARPLLADLVTAGLRASGPVRDLGFGGVGFWSDTPLPVGCEGSASFRFAGRDRVVSDVRMRVVRCVSEQDGPHLVGCTFRARADLDSAVARLLSGV